MKTILKYIIEKLKINHKSKIGKEIEDPKINTVAYDYNGDEWTITAICDLSKNRSEINKFIKKYDGTGGFDEIIEDDPSILDNYDYAVAAETDKNPWGDNVMWIWGYEGVCYENKKK